MVYCFLSNSMGKIWHGCFTPCFLFLPLSHTCALTLHYCDSTWGRRYSYSGNYLPHWCHISSRAFLPNGRVSMEPACVYCDVPWQSPFWYRGTLAHRSGQYFSPRLEVWGFSPLLPPALLAVPSLGACSGAPGPVLRQTWLIEREGCCLLISSDSSVLPEVGVPPHAESFHSKIKALSWKTQTVPRLPGQLAKGGRWILRTEERGETHFVCCTTSGRRAVPAFSENLTGNLPFHSGLDWNVTTSFFFKEYNN